MTYTRTHTYTTFANPHLVCTLCNQPVHHWHNNTSCGCEEECWNAPCGHTAGVTSRCPSWSPVDGCTCTTPHGRTR
jgi:hypothetical protein